jgi:HD-GYP domain-containing protein (c-di-GMP phosphodiesterase class II)
MDSLIKSITTALDTVEHDILGASTNHGKRIAVLCAKMGKILGKNQNEVLALASCAMLHDNALTEYIIAELLKGNIEPEFSLRTASYEDVSLAMDDSPLGQAMKKHCEFGQQNIDALDFKTGIKGFILFHHERADGKGPYGMKEGQGPVEAELIAIADSVDVTYSLKDIKEDDLQPIRRSIENESGKRHSKAAVKVLLEILDWPMALSLKDNVINETANEILVPWVLDIGDESIFNLAGFITKIIDCKSIFTMRHSTQIANKAWFMAGYYKYSREEQIKLYLAASLHDLGKLVIPAAILEKPGKLTDDEFHIIKDHVYQTWELLKDIDGFQLICDWASNHHEKLDGKGYPFGKKADELDFNSRLMACLDIYQAVSEERPYHPARDHKSTMQILNEMANADALDKAIVNDLSTALAPFDGKDLPVPVFTSA